MEHDRRYLREPRLVSVAAERNGTIVLGSFYCRQALFGWYFIRTTMAGCILSSFHKGHIITCPLVERMTSMCDVCSRFRATC